MVNKLLYYKGEGTNPHFNLAIEEYFLHNLKKDQCILYLWQNKKTVVIGKNQNCWRECKIAAIEDDGGYLARRLSGGGAVFHDLGNLNFTFIINREDYDVSKQLDVILKALDKFGIVGEKSGRNDLTIQERKFSGNAFYKSSESCFHHGTLLVNVNMETLQKYLNVSADKMKAKGVASVPARMVNLQELNQDVTINGLKEKLIEAFGEVYQQKVEEIQEDYFDKEMLNQLRKKFESWEWCFGRAQGFEIEKEERFSWGELQIHLYSEAGRVKNAKLFSDAMETEFIYNLGDQLIDLCFDRKELCNKVRSAKTGGPDEESMKEDICTLIEKCF